MTTFPFPISLAKATIKSEYMKVRATLESQMEKEFIIKIVLDRLGRTKKVKVPDYDAIARNKARKKAIEEIDEIVRNMR